MSRKHLCLSAAATLLGSTALADAPRVAADIAPVHSLVARVMEGIGSPDLVIAQGASPHEYSLRPSEAGALQDADVVFWIGEDLTPWLADAVETLADDAQVVTLLDVEGLTLLDFREDALFEAHSHGDHDHDDHDHGDHDHDHDHAEKDHDHGDHDHDHAEHDHDHSDHDHDHDHAEKDHDHAEKDHDHGDHDHDHDHAHDDHDHDHDDDHAGHAHGEHDPHAWLSPDNAALWMNSIAAALSAADPENAGTYYANAATGIEELSALSAEINATLDPVRGGRFIVFHDAYQYFETAFDFPASGAISLSDASDPSPARIAEIQGRVTNEGISCVMSEPQFNPNLVSVVMDGSEATTAVLDPLGTELTLGPDLYPQLLQNLADILADCL